MLEIFLKLEMYYILITFFLLVFLFSYYVFKNRSEIKAIFKRLKVKDYVLIVVLILLRLISFFALGVFEDPFDGANAQNWTYKCQGEVLISSVPFFEKSLKMIDCHPGHAMLFGVNLGVLYFIFGNFSSLNGIILNLVLSILNSLIIYTFLIVTQKATLKRTISFFCALMFLFMPLNFFESSYSSVQYFGSIFILLFYLLFYIFVKSYEEQSNFNKILFVILFLLISCMTNVKFEYVFSAFASWILIFIFLIKKIKFKRLIKVTLRRQKLTSKKEKDLLKHFLIMSVVVLIALIHVYARSQMEGPLPNNPFGFSELERNISDMFLGDFSVYQINSIMLILILGSVFFLKKSILKMFYYYGYIFTMLFYFSFAFFNTSSTGYIFVIMTSFLIPFILFYENKLIKVIILVAITACFMMHFSEYSYNFDTKENIKNCLSDLSFIYPPNKINVGVWVYFDLQQSLGLHNQEIRNIGYNVKFSEVIESEYYFWHFMGYEIDPMTFMNCEDVILLPKSCIDMNRPFFFKKC